MTKVRARFSLSLAAVAASVIGLVVLIAFSAVNAWMQIDQALKDKVLTLAKASAYAAAGLAKESPDHEGRLYSILEEIASDPEVTAAGVVLPSGEPILEVGKKKLPKLLSLKQESYVFSDNGSFAAIQQFEIRKGCLGRGGSCGCGPDSCSCGRHGEWTLPPGRYGLAVTAVPKGTSGVRGLVLLVSSLALLVLAALAVAAAGWVRSSRRAERLSRDIALEKRRLMDLESLGVSAAGLAHELKNPLGAAAGYAQLLSEQTKDDTTRKRARLMQNELMRATERLEEFLSFAKRRALRITEVDLRNVVEETAALFTADASLSNVTYNVVLPESSVTVNGDNAALKELVGNLLLNALEASSFGGRVEIRLSEEREGALLQIRDFGVGIPARNLERVFLPYFTTKPKGTGLGLAVSRRIAEDHGAVLRIENAEGGGVIASVLFGIRKEI